MAIIFTEQERKTITRRMINIQFENAGYDSTLDTFAQQQALLLNVDNANTKFYNFYNTQVESYEDEIRLIDGRIALRYSPSDIEFAGQYGVGGIFYPNTPPVYIRLLPLISDGANINNTVKGLFFPTGTDSSNELNILNDTTNLDGLQNLITYLQSGITGASSASSISTGSIAGGPVVGATLTIVAGPTFTINDLVYITDGASSGIYKITNIVPSGGNRILTFTSILPAASAMLNPSIDNTVGGFSAGERQSLTAGSYQEILTNLANGIDAGVASWESNLVLQLSEHTSQNDTRLTQISQKAIAVNDINNAILLINMWQSLPQTGVTGRFVAASILPISNEITARQAFLPTRIAQIEAALGTSSANALSQSGETFTAVDQTNSYFKRYQWINFRVNRGSGSLRRYYLSLQSGDQVGRLKEANVALLDEYDNYFITKQVTFVDDQNDILQITDLVGLSAGDTIYIVTENQPEISRVIIEVQGTTQVKLDSPIPNTYLTLDLCRAFKLL